MKLHLLLPLALLATAQTGFGQTTTAPNDGFPVTPSQNPPPPDQQQTTQPNQPDQSSEIDNRGAATGLGKSIPFVDPSTGTLHFDGYSANPTNNPVFRSRFEKYLSTPAADTDVDESYRTILAEILELLSPNHEGGPDFPGAYARLKLASQYDIDGDLCDSMSNDIWAIWQVHSNIKNQRLAIDAMKEQQRRLAVNNETALAPNHLSGGAQPVGNGNGGGGNRPRRSNQPGNGNQTNPNEGGQETNPKTSASPPIIDGGKSVANMSTQDISLNYGRSAIYAAQITELQSQIAISKTTIALAKITTKVEFQAKIIQYFLSRRYEHVIVACRFYRNIFTDGSSDLQIKEGSEIEQMFTNGLGVAPTIGVLDSLAGEAMRDVNEAVEAFKMLAHRNEFDRASIQLAQAFLMGEFMPSVRRLPNQEKMRVLQYVSDSNQLIDALEVKDYELAEELIVKLRAEAKDFQYSKPNAAVKTAKTVSALHISAAKQATYAGDSVKAGEELQKAMQIWPNNPAITDFSNMITSASDVRGQALIDLDRLVNQKDYRQIFMDQGRYSAAVLGDANRQAKLAEVIQIMNEITITLSGARAASEHGNNWQAYEMVEKLYLSHGDDPEVSRMRSDLTRDVSEFVNALSKAEEFEKRDQVGASLTWYLKAKNIYDGSNFAKDGMNRVLTRMRKDETPQNDVVATTNTQTSPATSALQATPNTTKVPISSGTTTNSSTKGDPANGRPLTNPN